MSFLSKLIALNQYQIRQETKLLVSWYSSNSNSTMTTTTSSGIETKKVPADTIDLFSLATSCLASSMAASEPIRRIAMEATGRSLSPSCCSSSTSSMMWASGVSVNSKEENTSCKNSRAAINTNNTNTNNINNNSTTTNNNNKNNMRYRSKIDGTIVTDADGAAQKVIVDAIRAIHSSISIVREESDEEENRLQQQQQQQLLDTHHDLHLHCSTESIYNFAHDQIQECKKRLPSLALHSQVTQVDPNRVSVFVDPLDGTKHYAKAQYDSVSTLVAIVLDNTPIFGVICKPFGGQYSHTQNSPILQDQYYNTQPPPPCFAVYGGTLLQGVYIADSNSKEKTSNTTSYSRLLSVHIPQNLPAKAVISSSRSGHIVQELCTELYGNGNLHSKDPILVSGAGEKALRLLLGVDGEALWPFPKRGGSSLWDVAAADALLRAVGGCLSDQYGRPMNYLLASQGGCSTENLHGILASNRTDLHQACVDALQKILNKQSHNLME